MSGLAYRHQRVQRLRKLVGRRAARDDEGSFVLEGVNLLEEALAAGTAIEAVYVDAAWAARGPAPAPAPVLTPVPMSVPTGAQPDEEGSSARLSVLLQRCYDDGARVFELEEGVLARVAGTVTPQPVLTVARIPRCTLDDLGGRRSQLVLVLVCVDVRDPGNLGTVARSAWAAGADALVCTGGTVDPWNPKAVRASAGAVLHVPVVSAGGAAAALAEMGEWGLCRWGTVVNGGRDYAVADLAVPSAIVLGNEASGLPTAELAGVLDGLLSVPMTGGAESLNVGMAAAVICFEAARQRRLGTMVGHGSPHPAQ